MMPFSAIQNLFVRSGQGKLNNVSAPTSLQEVTSLAPRESIGSNNPFLLAQNSTSFRYRKIGVNEPLEKPMFLGYREEKPLYGGARLFILS
jgi:hypothetical protein